MPPFLEHHQWFEPPLLHRLVFHNAYGLPQLGERRPFAALLNAAERFLGAVWPWNRWAIVDPAAKVPGLARALALFAAILDAGVLVNTNGLGCISTPMGEPELEELATATERALARVREEDAR